MEPISTSLEEKTTKRKKNKLNFFSGSLENKSIIWGKKYLKIDFEKSCIYIGSTGTICLVIEKRQTPVSYFL